MIASGTALTDYRKVMVRFCTAFLQQPQTYSGILELFQPHAMKDGEGVAEAA